MVAGVCLNKELQRQSRLQAGQAQRHRRQASCTEILFVLISLQTWKERQDQTVLGKNQARKVLQNTQQAPRADSNVLLRVKNT